MLFSGIAASSLVTGPAGAGALVIDGDARLKKIKELTTRAIVDTSKAPISTNLGHVGCSHVRATDGTEGGPPNYDDVSTDMADPGVGGNGPGPPPTLLEILSYTPLGILTCPNELACAGPMIGAVTLMPAVMPGRNLATIATGELADDAAAILASEKA